MTEIVGHVVVQPVSRGRRIPLADSVTVVLAGVDPGVAVARGGAAQPVAAVDLSRLDDDDVLGELPGEEPA